MSKTSKLGLGFLDKIKKIKQDYQSNLTSYNEIEKSIEEALNYKKRDVGELKLDTSDFSDSNIQKMIEFYSETMNISKNEVEQKLKADAQEQLDYLQKAPVMCKNAIENLAAGSAFNMLQSIDLSKIDYNKLGINRSDLLDGDVFFDLTQQIIVENSDFFPLKNPFEPRSIKPFFFIAPDDVFMMADQNLKNSSQGDFTAFCTPDAKMVFNREFSERLALYSILTGIKSKSKKYKSNGGTFPDWYEYIEFVIVHELLHFSVGDHFYTKSKVDSIRQQHPEISTKLAHKILNYVGDYINNWTLVSSGYAQLPIGLFSEDINYDRIESYDGVIEKVIEEFKKLNPDDQEKVSDQMSKSQDDHVDNSDQQPSPGGEGNEPSEDTGQGQEGQGQEGQGQEGQGQGQGQDGEPSKGQGSSGSGKANQQSSKIDDAIKKSREKMENKTDNDKSKTANDVLNKTDDSNDVHDVTNAKKSAGTATTLLDTESKENMTIDWRKLLKKMVPQDNGNMEDTYSKMSRSATSSMVTVQQIGAGRITPGEIQIDSDKKGLLIIIDNSGSVYDVVGQFNNEILNLLGKYKNNLDNFFVMKFSDDFDLYKVDIKANKFQQVEQSEIANMFDKKGKKLKPKIKLKDQMKNLKTELFRFTFAGATYWKPGTQFIAESFWNAGYNIILFTDDDLAYSDAEQFKKFYKMADRKKGQVAMFITTKNALDNMIKKFGPRKWVTYFK